MLLGNQLLKSGYIFYVFTRKSMYKTSLVLLLLLSTKAAVAYAAKNEVQLAQPYKNEDITAYLISEKYDGIRAIWKNNALRTRQGHIIHAPLWFTEHLPNIWLDGELWSQREDFEFIASTVRKKTAHDEQWQHIKYMVFDAPDYTSPFHKRVNNYSQLIRNLDLAHIKAVKQFKVDSHNALMTLLSQYTQNGAEGLMLQKADALFTDGRNANLLKLKPYMDAEATVLAHYQGQGKYANCMGAMLVAYINEQGVTRKFKIGTGFSDAERKAPPAVGNIITFSYHGFTKNGIPRFASFVRVRSAMQPEKHNTVWKKPNSRS